MAIIVDLCTSFPKFETFRELYSNPQKLSKCSIIKYKTHVRIFTYKKYFYKKISI
jgi:hypothetical protein